jgi:hypothetical protein
MTGTTVVLSSNIAQGRKIYQFLHETKNKSHTNNERPWWFPKPQPHHHIPKPTIATPVTLMSPSPPHHLQSEYCLLWSSFLFSNRYSIFPACAILLHDCHHDWARGRDNNVMTSQLKYLLSLIHLLACVSCGIAHSGSSLGPSGWAIHQVWRVAFHLPSQASQN